MKIAIVRGPSLNKFEMQYYEPLVSRHKLVCFGSKKPVYDTTTIKLPIIQLSCLGQTIGAFPGGVGILNRLFGDPQGLIGLENEINGFDIVHTAELFSAYTHQALVAKKKGRIRKVVATVSENIPFNHEWFPKQKSLKQFALANLDYILAISPLSKKAMETEGFPKDKIEVVPHGLDLELFKKRRKDQQLVKKYKIKKQDMVILSVGRLVWEKGFGDLLLAAENLLKDKDLKDKSLKFLIIGGGPGRGSLVELRDRLGLKKTVYFVEGMPYDQMAKIYSLADIFVLASLLTPTWQEQFGMVLIEAMACGLPVVSTKSGGIPETVGTAGILTSPNLWPELAEAIKKLVLDRNLRMGLSQKGRERVEKKFDRFLVAKNIEKIYQKVLGM